jgi:hypothetical protein
MGLNGAKIGFNGAKMGLTGAKMVHLLPEFLFLVSPSPEVALLGRGGLLIQALDLRGNVFEPRGFPGVLSLRGTGNEMTGVSKCIVNAHIVNA